MSRLLSLYQQLQNQGIHFFTWDLDDQESVTIEMNGRYGIFMDFDNIENAFQEIVVLAHEGGHAVTGATHSVCSPFDLVEHHEELANRWAIKKLLPFDEMKAAMQAGYTDSYQLADHFEVTEEFVHQAFTYYTEACGFDFNS